MKKKASVQMKKEKRDGWYPVSLLLVAMVGVSLPVFIIIFQRNISA